MSDSPLMQKSKAFALDIIRICNEIHETKHEGILTKQLVRSGTSIGANIREAFYAPGKRISLPNFKSPSKSVPRASIGSNF